LGEVQSAILSPMDLMKRFMGGVPQTAPAQASGQSEVEALRQRVAELETKLATSPARKPRKRKSH
jgi:BMFP domain-containing protein YqiC